MLKVEYTYTCDVCKADYDTHKYEVHIGCEAPYPERAKWSMTWEGVQGHFCKECADAMHSIIQQVILERAQ